MKVFIVHAHHEPSSFNAALTGHALAILRSAGHEVQVSDLYAMGFDPVSDRRNFLTVKTAERLRQQDEEAYASAHAGFSPQLQAEMDKLAWCELLVLQFPLWWLGMPAILKGWVDRVFAVGFAYGGGRYFDRGVFAGKRALCSLTAGGPAEVWSIRSGASTAPSTPSFTPSNTAFWASSASRCSNLSWSTRRHVSESRNGRSN